MSDTWPGTFTVRDAQDYGNATDVLYSHDGVSVGGRFHRARTQDALMAIKDTLLAVWPDAYRRGPGFYRLTTDYDREFYREDEDG